MKNESYWMAVLIIASIGLHSLMLVLYPERSHVAFVGIVAGFSLGVIVPLVHAFVIHESDDVPWQYKVPASIVWVGTFYTGVYLVSNFWAVTRYTAMAWYLLPVAGTVLTMLILCAGNRERLRKLKAT